MVQELRQSRNVIVVPQTSEQFQSALRRYRQASGQKLESDRLAQAGFETLLR
jgi:hypothetical protein